MNQEWLKGVKQRPGRVPGGMPARDRGSSYTSAQGDEGVLGPTKAGLRTQAGQSQESENL